MKRIIILFSLMIVVSLPLLAIFNDYEPSVRARALAGAYTSVSDNYEGVFYNPAGISLAGTQFGGAYTQLFGNDFSALTTMGGTYPVKGFGTFGFAFQDFSVDFEDVDLMGEKTITLAHSVCLNKDVNSEVYLGYTANMYQLSFDGLGSENTYGFNVGVLAILHSRTRLGFTMVNINKPNIGSENEHDLPQRLAAGISYIPYQGVVTSFDVKKSYTGDSEYRFGVEAELHPMLTLRTGIRNNPAQYSFGLGVKPYMGIQMDYALSYHSVLDMTHHFGLAYKF